MMNSSDGMSDDELDVWADIFCQAKVGEVIEVTFSQFISNPLAHLSPGFQKRERPVTEKPHLRLVCSNGELLSSDPEMVPNSPQKLLDSRNDEEATS